MFNYSLSLLLIIATKNPGQNMESNYLRILISKQKQADSENELKVEKQPIYQIIFCPHSFFTRLCPNVLRTSTRHELIQGLCIKGKAKHHTKALKTELNQDLNHSSSLRLTHA